MRKTHQINELLVQSSDSAALPFTDEPVFPNEFDSLVDLPPELQLENQGSEPRLGQSLFNYCGLEEIECNAGASKKTLDPLIIESNDPLPRNLTSPLRFDFEFNINDDFKFDHTPLPTEEIDYSPNPAMEIEVYKLNSHELNENENLDYYGPAPFDLQVITNPLREFSRENSFSNSPKNLPTNSPANFSLSSDFSLPSEVTNAVRVLNTSFDLSQTLSTLFAGPQNFHLFNFFFSSLATKFSLLVHPSILPLGFSTENPPQSLPISSNEAGAKKKNKKKELKNKNVLNKIPASQETQDKIKKKETDKPKKSLKKNLEKLENSEKLNLKRLNKVQRNLKEERREEINKILDQIKNDGFLEKSLKEKMDIFKKITYRANEINAKVKLWSLIRKDITEYLDNIKNFSEEEIQRHKKEIKQRKDELLTFFHDILLIRTPYEKVIKDFYNLIKEDIKKLSVIEKDRLFQSMVEALCPLASICKKDLATPDYNPLDFLLESGKSFQFIHFATKLVQIRNSELTWEILSTKYLPSIEEYTNLSWFHHKKWVDGLFAKTSLDQYKPKMEKKEEKEKEDPLKHYLKNVDPSFLKYYLSQITGDQTKKRTEYIEKILSKQAQLIPDKNLELANREKAKELKKLLESKLNEINDSNQLLETLALNFPEKNQIIEILHHLLSNTKIHYLTAEIFNFLETKIADLSKKDKEALFFATLKGKHSVKDFLNAFPGTFLDYLGEPLSYQFKERFHNVFEKSFSSEELRQKYIKIIIANTNGNVEKQTEWLDSMLNNASRELTIEYLNAIEDKPFLKDYRNNLLDLGNSIPTMQLDYIEQRIKAIDSTLTSTKITKVNASFFYSPNLVALNSLKQPAPKHGVLDDEKKQSERKALSKEELLSKRAPSNNLSNYLLDENSNLGSDSDSDSNKNSNKESLNVLKKMKL